MAINALCSIQGCSNPRHAKGLCRIHRRDQLRAELGSCKIDGCGNDCFSMSLRLCSKHYSRQLRTGNTDIEGTAPGSTARFIDTIALPFESDECLLWPFSQDHDGYGRAYYNGRPVKASRIVCELSHGTVPFDGAEAAHSCGKSECVNPRHLYWATPRENASDRERHGTHPHGADSPNAKLTEDQVREIRRLRGSKSQSEVAKRFGVSKTGVWNIWARKSWSHVE